MKFISVKLQYYKQTSPMFRKLAVLKKHFSKVSKIFWHGICKVPHFKISEYFLRGIAVNPFIQEVVALLKMTCSEYIAYRTNFSSKDDLNCVTENVYI